MKNAIMICAVIFTVSLMASCTNQKTETADNAEKAAAEAVHPGESLFMAYCYSCHNDQSQGSDRIAPPMIAIQNRYKMEYPEKQAFIDAMVAFIQKPTEENVLMMNAISKFGIMPPMAYPENDIKEISDFIYSGDFKHPGQSGMQDNGDKMPPLPRGKFIAGSTKSVLGQNLMGAIKKQGASGAVTFCSERAVSITDSMAQNLNAISIQRISDKNRNAKNYATQEELAILNEFKNDLSNTEESKPVLITQEEAFVFYAPITTNQMCLQCHGTSDQILPETLAKIKSIYPDDIAIGYAENQVRGMWKIVMAKN